MNLRCWVILLSHLLLFKTLILQTFELAVVVLTLGLLKLSNGLNAPTFGSTDQKGTLFLILNVILHQF